MIKMFIVVKGGMVQEICCDTNEIDVEVVDQDTLDSVEKDNFKSVVKSCNMKRISF